MEILHRARRKRLALDALEGRNADGAILNRIPDNGSECAHVRKRHITLALDVANQRERILVRGTIVNAQRTTVLRCEERRQRRPDNILGTKLRKDGRRHLERKDKSRKECLERKEWEAAIHFLPDAGFNFFQAEV